MSIVFVALVLGQKVVAAQPNPHWAKFPTNQAVSAEWRAIRSQTLAEAARLAKLAPEARRKHFAGMQREMQYQMSRRGGDVEPKLVYRGATFGMRFPSEAKSEQSTFEYACGRLPGSPDPEFRRAVYVFWCTRWSPGYWQGLGRSLLRAFPDDIALKEAFTIDAHQGSVELEDLDLALRIFAENKEFGKPKARAMAFYSAVWQRKFRKTRLKSHLDEAIRFKEAFLAIEDPKSQSAEVARTWLRILKKDRAEGNYKPG